MRQFLTRVTRRRNAAPVPAGATAAPLSAPVAAPEDDPWREGLAAELAFWRKWFVTRGGQWAESFNDRQDPERPLQEAVRSLVEVEPGGTLPVLDVGAGPLTFLGKRWDGRTIDITAVDALADEYDRIMDDAGVEPLVRTRRGETEHLAALFAPGSFDVVCASNTLDHSYDPLGAIKQMVRVARPGGAVFMRHLQNEAEHEHYSGLHQWNLFVDDGHITVWSLRERHDVGEALDGIAAVERAEATTDRWHEVVLRV